ncbi:MAG: DUF5018 domain-containing protein [Treponema sp.]|jgi:hypothetical protein|nr:DUF5018 domain-containing protein [Treponema sp.]
MKTLNFTNVTHTTVAAIAKAVTIMAALFLSGAMFSSCALPENEAYGTLALSLPGGDAAARAAVSGAFTATLTYRIECDGPGGSITRQSAAGASLSIPLNAGDWTVRVTVLNAAGQSIGSATAAVVIESGRTTALQMPVAVDTKGNDILRFAITSPVSAEGVIVPNSTMIAVSVPFGTELTGMDFTVTHTGASINPAPGTPLDFDSPRSFTVKAENGQEKKYTVTVNVSPPSAPDGATAVWPSVTTWQSYGLFAGLAQPPGTAIYTALVSSGTLLVYLQNADTAAFDNLVSQFSALPGVPTTSVESGYRFYELAYTYGGANFTLSLTYGSGMLLLSIEPDDPSGFTVWPGNSRWTVFNLSGLTQPPGTTVEDVSESESPAYLSVTLSRISHAVYGDLLSQISSRLGSPFASTGSSATQNREDNFMSTAGGATLVVMLEMDTSSDAIIITAIK